MKLSIYIIVLIGGSFLIYMRKNAEPIESSDSQSIRHNEQETVSNFVKVFLGKKEQTPEFFSESALNSLENKKTPVQVHF